MKHKLVYHPNEHSNLTAYFLTPIWQQYFECEPLQENKTYDKNTTVFWSKHLNEDGWFHPWRDSGYKIAIDHLWDNPIDVVSQVNDNTLTLQAGNWIWYNESLWYQSLEYDNYQRQPINEKFFLMLIRQAREHKEKIFEKTKNLHDDCLISFVDRGVLLDEDLDPDDCLFQRNFNPSWYDRTSWSMAIESIDTDTKDVSEKTFKPMAFQHGFIVWGSPLTLKYLQREGFATFDHVVDESYDLMLSSDQRFDLIHSEVERLYREWKNGKIPFSDKESLEKIQHNFHHFYHPSIKSRFKQEIIDPLLEFASA